MQINASATNALMEILGVYWRLTVGPAIEAMSCAEEEKLGFHAAVHAMLVVYLTVATRKSTLFIPRFLRQTELPRESDSLPVIFHKRKLEDVIDLRGGGYIDGVYMCESSDMDGRKSLLKPEIYTLNITLNPDMPSMLREAMATRMRSLRTNDDGACGVHALLGAPLPMSVGVGRYELFAGNARDIAVQHLGPSLAALEQRLHIEDRVRAIKDFFWDGFVVAHLKGPPHQTPESESFWSCLTRMNPQLAQAALDVFTNNTMMEEPYKHAKAETLRASRDFFHRSMESEIIRPLATQMGYIPVGVDVFSLSLKQNENNWLKSFLIPNIWTTHSGAAMAVCV